MTITAVQSATGTGSGNTTATLSSSPTANNTLIAVVLTGTSDVNISIAGFTKDAAHGAAGWYTSIWSRTCDGTESTDVTVTGAASTTNIVVREYSGITLTPVDQVVSANGASAFTSSLSPGTTAETSQADELAIAAVGVSGGFSAQSFSDDFVLQHTLSRLIVADLVLSSAQTVTTTASWTSGRSAAAVLVTYKAGSVLPPPGARRVGVPAFLRSGPGNSDGDPAPFSRASWLDTTVSLVNHDDDYYPWNPVVEYGQQSGVDDYQIREHGNALYDPVTGMWIMVYTTLDFDGGTCTISASLSNNADQWWRHPDNPICGLGLGAATRGEDPYLCKNLDGTVHRDSSGRALIYAEEKPSGAGSQDGIHLFRSAPWTLDTWVNYGQVLDNSGVSESWDRDDRTSPIVLWDGSQYVMLFEGRNNTDSPENKGEVGVAFSADGLIFTLGNGGDPIIDRASVGTWAAGGIVPDDVAKFGSTWVLLCHGQAVGAGGASAFNNMGRWQTTDDPADWDSSSFTEMSGNPFDTTTGTVMYVGDRDGVALSELDRHELLLGDIE